MDPVEAVAPPRAAVANAAAASGPKIVHLSPLPGNIYKSDRFYYDPAASLLSGPFAAVLAFAAAHGHPDVVHDCHDLHEFQMARPTAVVHPISELSPAMLARGLSLLAQASASIEPAVDALASVGATTPPGSSLLLSYESHSRGRGGDPPSSGSWINLATASVHIPPVICTLPAVAHIAPRPDPYGLDAPPPLMGGRVFQGHIGPSPIYGGSPQVYSFASAPSTADQWRAFAFPGGLPSTVPAFIHCHCRTFPSDGGFPEAPASVASTLAPTAPPLRPLSHEDLSGSSSSDLTMSAWPPTSVDDSPGVAVPVPGFSPGVPLASAASPITVPGAAIPTPGFDPGAAVPVSGLAPSARPSALLAGLSRAKVPAPSLAQGGLDDESMVINVAPSPAPIPVLRQVEPFKLPPVADTKAFLNLSSILQYYLCHPEFSTQRSDGELITDDRNAEASAYWEGQLWVAVQDGSLKFLFENKGSVYDGKGFEMLAALHCHYHPDTVANAFSTLMSLFNDSMDDSEDIIAFRSRFDGMRNEMSRCKVVIPHLLMVMFFLRSLHSRYSPLLDQFWSRAQPLKTATPSTMSREEIISIIHHEGSSLPSVRPCDTPNNSDTKTHWTAEEIHRAMGC